MKKEKDYLNYNFNFVSETLKDLILNTLAILLVISVCGTAIFGIIKLGIFLFEKLI